MSESIEQWEIEAILRESQAVKDAVGKRLSAEKSRTASVLRMLLCDGPRAVLHSFRRPRPVLLEEPLRDEALIPFPDSFSIRQGFHECGPFSQTAHLFGQTGTYLPPNQVIKETPVFLPNGYTYPHHYENWLTGHGAAVRSFDTSSFSEEQSFRFLQQRISRGFPVSVVSRMHDQLHFSVIFGAWLKGALKRMTVDVYDPLMEDDGSGKTLIANGDRPGNRSFPFSNFFRKRWKHGNAGPLYKGLAITGLIDEEA